MILVHLYEHICVPLLLSLVWRGYLCCDLKKILQICNKPFSIFCFESVKKSSEIYTILLQSYMYKAYMCIISKVSF
ncbi:hypothetical protein HanIR_Chr07g0337591 [Helianthus annuus]|nr:hypothetical protein HanIR_Chr07g0337591 [Helianthus annuus]